MIRFPQNSPPPGPHFEHDNKTPQPASSRRRHPLLRRPHNVVEGSIVDRRIRQALLPLGTSDGDIQRALAPLPEQTLAAGELGRHDELVGVVVAVDLGDAHSLGRGPGALLRLDVGVDLVLLVPDLAVSAVCLGDPGFGGCGELGLVGVDDAIPLLYQCWQHEGQGDGLLTSQWRNRPIHRDSRSDRCPHPAGCWRGCPRR